MPLKTLPSSPDVEHLKRQAKALLAGQRVGDVRALQRIREFHPRFADKPDSYIRAAPMALSDAQFAIAREYGFASWPKLRNRVAQGSRPDTTYEDRIEDPLFRRAVEFSDSGAVDALGVHLSAHPSLTRQRVFFAVSDYFGEPYLLEFVAENPVRRGTMPSAVLEVAHCILDAGTDQLAIDRTIGLVASGRVARECRAQTPLIDLLCDYGGDAGSAMAAALGHGEFAAVDALLRRGASKDLAVAAALDDVDAVARILPHASAEACRRALAYATQFGRLEVVRLLLAAGVSPNGFNPIGCHSHSTPLHQAALNGHLAVVRLLVQHGADVGMKDILFNGTPLGWAMHGHQHEVAEYLRAVK